MPIILIHNRSLKQSHLCKPDAEPLRFWLAQFTNWKRENSKMGKPTGENREKRKCRWPLKRLDNQNFHVTSGFNINVYIYYQPKKQTSHKHQFSYNILYRKLTNFPDVFLNSRFGIKMVAFFTDIFLHEFWTIKY